jgi:hypothetical protein
MFSWIRRNRVNGSQESELTMIFFPRFLRKKIRFLSDRKTAGCLREEQSKTTAIDQQEDSNRSAAMSV